jgi:hypothetical protein
MLGLWMTDPGNAARAFVTLYRAARAAGRRVAIPHTAVRADRLDLFTVCRSCRVLDDGRPRRRIAGVLAVDGAATGTLAGHRVERRAGRIHCGRDLVRRSRPALDEIDLGAGGRPSRSRSDSMPRRSVLDRRRRPICRYVVRQFSHVSTAGSHARTRRRVATSAVYVAAFDRAGP